MINVLETQINVKLRYGQSRKGVIIMTLEEAIKRNPFNPNIGNESAYCRYLRYNVTGWYNLDSKEVRRRWQSVMPLPEPYQSND